MNDETKIRSNKLESISKIIVVKCDSRMHTKEK